MTKITIEQVLDRLIVSDMIDYASLYHSFHFSELYRRIHSLGSAKANGPKMFIRINDETSIKNLNVLTKDITGESSDNTEKENQLSMGVELTRKDCE